MEPSNVSNPKTNDNDFVAGNNFDKYRSKNPIHQQLMNCFLADLEDLARKALGHLHERQSLLEVGCGPGDLAQQLLRRLQKDPSLDYTGIDLSTDEIDKARRNCPDLRFEIASATELPFPPTHFDFAIACEVLEHLDNPRQALCELHRVTKGPVIVSVPWEPVWRVLNCFRGKYLSSFGNTPGHIQRFSRKAIRTLVSEYFDIREERNPFPWTMLLIQKKT